MPDRMPERVGRLEADMSNIKQRVGSVEKNIGGIFRKQEEMTVVQAEMSGQLKASLPAIARSMESVHQLIVKQNGDVKKACIKSERNEEAIDGLREIVGDVKDEGVRERSRLWLVIKWTVVGAGLAVVGSALAKIAGLL